MDNLSTYYIDQSKSTYLTSRMPYPNFKFGLAMIDGKTISNQQVNDYIAQRFIEQFLELKKAIETKDEIKYKNYATQIYDINAMIHYKGKNGMKSRTLLHIASKSMNIDAVKTLLECGADTNIKTEKGKIAFQLAAKKPKDYDGILSLLATPIEGHSDQKGLILQTKF